MKDVGPVWAADGRPIHETRRRSASMAQRLDARDASLSARLRQAARRQARDLRGRRPGGPNHHRRRGGARRRGPDRLYAAASTISTLTPRRLRISDAEIDAACRNARADALEALWLREGAHRGLPPGAAAATIHMAPTRSASRSAGAGRRSNRSGSTCRAARASYPSSVLMNAVPAKVAGVPRIAMVVPTPARRDQSAGAGGCAPCRRRRDLPDRRRAGGRGARLRHGDRSRRSPRSSVPAMPMWRPPSGASSGRSAST